jgi:hypothetical protein
MVLIIQAGSAVFIRQLSNTRRWKETTVMI